MPERCSWCGTDALYVHYHDTEWGVPVRDDQRLFEFLILEGAQAGLSWITVLKKRAHYRAVMAGFDPVKIARYTEDDVTRLLADPGIIRNRLKIESAITNAQAFLRIQAEFGSFSHFLWQYVNEEPIQNTFPTLAAIPTHSPLSDALSRDLKKRGFRFVGTTIMYAFMQAVGMVNDHVTHCFRYSEIGKHVVK